MSSLPIPLAFAQDKFCYILINLRVSFTKHKFSYLLTLDTQSSAFYSIQESCCINPVSLEEGMGGVSAAKNRGLGGLGVAGAPSPLTSSSIFSSPSQWTNLPVLLEGCALMLSTLLHRYRQSLREGGARTSSSELLAGTFSGSLTVPARPTKM